MSARIHPDDMVRAMRRASSLSSVLNTKCRAAVAGASIDEVTEAAAERNGVMVFTPNEWQQLAV